MHGLGIGDYITSPNPKSFLQQSNYVNHIHSLVYLNTYRTFHTYSQSLPVLRAAFNEAIYQDIPHPNDIRYNLAAPSSAGHLAQIIYHRSIFEKLDHHLLISNIFYSKIIIAGSTVTFPRLILSNPNLRNAPIKRIRFSCKQREACFNDEVLRLMIPIMVGYDYLALQIVGGT